MTTRRLRVRYFVNRTGHRFARPYFDAVESIDLHDFMRALTHDIKDGQAFDITVTSYNRMLWMTGFG